MTKIKEGDRVQITSRTQTANDIKSGLYYPHYGNLRGVVLKIYGEETSVLIDRDTLPLAILARQEETEKIERRRYLDRLSEEVRNRATERERNFQLNYAVLVSVNDVTIDESATEQQKRATEAELSAAEEAFLAERAKQTA